MSQTLRRIRAEPFDLIVLENTCMTRFLQDLPAHVPKVLNCHDVLSLLSTRRAESATTADEIARADVHRILCFEKRAVSQCALCITVSEQEASAARTLLGASKVEVVSNGVDTTFFTPGPRQAIGCRLLFTGTMVYWPNIKAVEYFAETILPSIRRAVP